MRGWTSFNRWESAVGLSLAGAFVLTAILWTYVRAIDTNGGAEAFWMPDARLEGPRSLGKVMPVGWLLGVLLAGFAIGISSLALGRGRLLRLPNALFPVNGRWLKLLLASAAVTGFLAVCRNLGPDWLLVSLGFWGALLYVVYATEPYWNRTVLRRGWAGFLR